MNAKFPPDPHRGRVPRHPSHTLSLKPDLGGPKLSNTALAVACQNILCWSQSTKINLLIFKDWSLVLDLTSGEDNSIHGLGKNSDLLYSESE